MRNTSFAAESRESNWSSCIKAAIVICQQLVSILALVSFLLKFLLKSASKSSFFNFCCHSRSSIVFCNSVSADGIVMAASRLRGAAAACVILVEGSLVVKLPTIWTDEKQNREEAERRERLEERRSEKRKIRREKIREEKESEERRCRCEKR